MALSWAVRTAGCCWRFWADIVTAQGDVAQTSNTETGTEMRAGRREEREKTTLIVVGEGRVVVSGQEGRRRRGS